jgi:hypothetical protein
MIDLTKMKHYYTLIVALSFGLCTVLGCGRSDLAPLHGTVTFGDEPLGCGSITFVCVDTSERGQAPAPPTAVGIRDGKYSLGQKHGLLKGQYRVAVNGLEGKPRGDLALGLNIFPEHREIFDYTGQETHDFAVPALKSPMRQPSEAQLDAASSKQD